VYCGGVACLSFVSACVVVDGERLSVLNCVCSLSAAVVLDGLFLVVYVLVRM
jgi:hypothetical protein